MQVTIPELDGEDSVGGGFEIFVLPKEEAPRDLDNFLNELKSNYIQYDYVGTTTNVFATVIPINGSVMIRSIVQIDYTNYEDEIVDYFIIDHKDYNFKIRSFGPESTRSILEQVALTFRRDR